MRIYRCYVYRCKNDTSDFRVSSLSRQISSLQTWNDISRWYHQRKSLISPMKLFIRSLILGAEDSWSGDIIAGFPSNQVTQEKRLHRRCNINDVNKGRWGIVIRMVQTVARMEWFHRRQIYFVKQRCIWIHPTFQLPLVDRTFRWGVTSIRCRLHLNLSKVAHWYWPRTRWKASTAPWKHRRFPSLPLYRRPQSPTLPLVESQPIPPRRTVSIGYWPSRAKVPSKAPRDNIPSSWRRRFVVNWFRSISISSNNNIRKLICHTCRYCRVPPMHTLMTHREYSRFRTWNLRSTMTILNRTSHFQFPQPVRSTMNKSTAGMARCLSVLVAVGWKRGPLGINRENNPRCRG